MGIYEGGFLLLLTFFTVIGIWFIMGDLQQTAPDLTGQFDCVPNQSGTDQYVQGVSPSNCFDQNNNQGFNLTNDPNQKSNPAVALLTIFPGGQSFSGALTFLYSGIDLVIGKGWPRITEILIGDNIELKPLGFFISIPLSITIAIAITFFVIVLIGIIRGGTKVFGL